MYTTFLGIFSFTQKISPPYLYYYLLKTFYSCQQKTLQITDRSLILICQSVKGERWVGNGKGNVNENTFPLEKLSTLSK